MSDPFVGQIMQVGFNFAPQYWSTCAGQTISIPQNTALFSLLGTYFGGNGVNTFQLPNLQGRVMVGTGTGASGTPYLIGEQAGVESVTLSLGQMPVHNHQATFTPSGGSLSGTGTLSASTSAGTASTPAAGMLLAQSNDQGDVDTPQIYIPAGSAGTTVALGGLNVTVSGATGGSVVVATNGSSLPVSLMQPFLAVTTIIAMSGLFPTRG